MKRHPGAPIHLLQPMSITTYSSHSNAPLLPLGALLLAGSLSAHSQDIPDTTSLTLPTVLVTDHALQAGRDSLRATSTEIGKGTQMLRNVPQSVTVVTEKLIDDRNLDTLKEVLHSTAGVSFQAAEGGEEDIRLRGFSLATVGDIYLDGMRDPAFYDRDTFNNERIELLRGSASMLFGRGSTGGVVNQVSKAPREWDESLVSVTLGSHNFRRITGDFNVETGEQDALRINAMATTADNSGAGSRIDKRGLAAAYRFGIGSANEFQVNLSTLQNRNGMNYGIPWIKPTASAPVTATTVNSQLDPADYFGMASDYNNSSASTGSASHIHRFGNETELKTAVRAGRYQRDQRAGTVRYCVRSVNASTGAVSNPQCPDSVTLDTFTSGTLLNRGNNPKIQDLDAVYAQSDLSSKFSWGGLRHEVLAGIDAAREAKSVYAVSGVTKPKTLAGTPNDGAAIDERQRWVLPANSFAATNVGLYAQDMLHLNTAWKVLGGVRFDSMRGSFTTRSTTANNAGAVVGAYGQTISDWSQRAGVLYQPDEWHSYHFSYGTSFNTSADTYSYSALSANTAPEQSRNIELGARLESADKRLSTRFAVFQSTKLNERNTDPDSAATAFLLSGKRHSSGLEVDMTGKLTPQWELFLSYMWMPDAVIDVAAPTAGAGDRAGERPALTPVHSGTAWTTYQWTPRWRVGAGLNFRSEQSPNRNPGWMAPAFAAVDLMTEYRLTPTAELRANLGNAGNVLYADSLYTGHYIPGAGRNLQVTLKLKL